MLAQLELALTPTWYLVLAAMIFAIGAVGLLALFMIQRQKWI